MKKLFFILLSTLTFAQQDVTGLWISQEGEFVTITENTFERYTKDKTTLAKGIIEVTEQEMFIIRKDTLDNYTLCYYVGNETMVVCKPRDEKVWLFYKIR
tara:strand:- start:190 stop:489 length:300 start_codon:yes stop_codon:yes gene_type:complete